MGRFLRLFLFALICVQFLAFAGCGSAVSIDDNGFSSNSPHAEDHVIIQTRQDGEHLEVFSLGQAFAPGVSPYVFTQEERDRDYLAGRSGGTLGQSINGTLYRYPVDWDMTTDMGFNDGTRVSLDGGDGAYITDHAIEATRRVSFPSVDGTYYYDFFVTNTKGYGPLNSRYTYTRSGGQATLTWRDWSGNLFLVYQGAPQSSLRIGFGFLIQNTFFHAVPEATQDARYTGTWTISENLNGVEGVTGQFDLRRIGVTNLTINPENFNPVQTENVEITADVVALPVETELTPDGWTPGNTDWLIEIDDPMQPRTPIVTRNGSFSPTPPDANGKIGEINATWDGKSEGEFLMNASYPVRVQALGHISSGGALSHEKHGAIELGALGVKITNLTATPEVFDPEAGETTELTFDLEAIGFENPDLSWKVEVYEKDGTTPLYTFDEPTEPVLQKMTTVTYTWNGITDSGPIIGDFEYRVEGRACEAEVSTRSVDPVSQRALFQTDGGVCAFKTDSTQGSVSGISIENETLTPEEPFVEPDSDVELTADIVVAAPGDFDLFWTVWLQDPEGNSIGPEGLKLAEGEGAVIRATWNGKINDLPVEEPNTYEFFIEAHACPSELQLPAPNSDCLDADKLVGLGGNRAVITFLDLNGSEINQVEPSYAFQVVQSLDVIDRDGQDPGSQTGEEIVTPKIQPSIVQVDIEFISVRTRDETYVVQVDIDEVGAGTQRDGGHLHENAAPPGVLAKERLEVEKDFDALSSVEKSKIGDGAVAIAAPEEMTFNISSGERKVTLYYLAPISSDLRRFIVTKEGDTKEVGSKSLLVGFGGLEKLASRLTLSGVPFVLDPGAPNPEPKPPGGIVLTGKTSGHQDNLNGTPNFNIRLAQLARLWMKNEDERTLRYNDMSLPLGGKFSVNGTYEVRAKHTEHRVGENIDINSDLNREHKRDVKLEDYVIRAGLTVYDETEEQHYHLRFPKGGN